MACSSWSFATDERFCQYLKSFLRECCLPALGGYVTYDGSNATSLRRALSLWLQVHNLPSAYELPDPSSPYAGHFKELVATLLHTPITKIGRAGPHGRVKGMYQGWRLSSTDISVFQRVLTPEEKRKWLASYVIMIIIIRPPPPSSSSSSSS